ncbi:MAG: methionine synthase [Deltaproteobacteria bacterium]|nr:methionine synthase [Deltaproteobacteria bacterium]
MGYRNGVTRIEEERKREIEDAIEYARSLIHLTGAAVRIPIEEIGQFNIVLSKGIVFNSRGLARMLKGCAEALLMGATAGKEIMEAIDNDSKTNRLTRGVILDAVASEMVDDSLDWIADYFNGQLRRENRRLTKRRFSAGYGDFLLENQKIMYDVLELGTLGVELTESFMLVPQKSVTAVAGIMG